MSVFLRPVDQIVALHGRLIGVACRLARGHVMRVVRLGSSFSSLFHCVDIDIWYVRNCSLIFKSIDDGRT